MSQPATKEQAPKEPPTYFLYEDSTNRMVESEMKVGRISELLATLKAHRAPEEEIHLAQKQLEEARAQVAHHNERRLYFRNILFGHKADV